MRDGNIALLNNINLDFIGIRTFELLCGKLLLTETATCFYLICERRSPLAREILLCDRAEQIIGGYPKKITFFYFPGIYCSGKM